MQPLVRLLLVAAVLAAIAYVGLYMMAVHFEPPPEEVRKSLPGVRIDR